MSKSKKLSKVDKAIQELRVKNVFDCFEVMKKTTNKLFVVIGNTKHKISKLIECSLTNGESKTLLINGEIDFGEFVLKVKEERFNDVILNEGE